MDICNLQLAATATFFHRRRDHLQHNPQCTEDGVGICIQLTGHDARAPGSTKYIHHEFSNGNAELWGPMATTAYDFACAGAPAADR